MFALNLCLALNLVILFTAFFFRKANTLPNKVLALLLLDTAISFFGNASVVSGFFVSFPYIFFLSWCTSCFFSPLFFTYTGLFTGLQLSFRHPIWIACFLIALFGLTFPVHYFLLPVAGRANFVQSLMQEPLPWEMTAINTAGMLLILVSMVASAIRVIRYQRRLLSTLSNLEKTKLTFIKQFVGLGLFLTIATIVLYLSVPQYLVEYLYLPGLITTIYFFILFYSFQHHAIFTPETYGEFIEATLPANVVVEEKELETIKASSVELRTLVDRVDALLISTEIYTAPELTINQLAERLNVTPDKLSAAINRELNKNFYDLINEKRVDRAKQLLNEQLNNLTIEAIGYAAGFNSRASFYRSFKKHTSFTPSEYVKLESK